MPRLVNARLRINRGDRIKASRGDTSIAVHVGNDAGHSVTLVMPADVAERLAREIERQLGKAPGDILAGETTNHGLVGRSG